MITYETDQYIWHTAYFGERSMMDNRRRAIAALEVELQMTETTVKKLSSAAPTADPSQQNEIAALIKEENERAEQLRHQLLELQNQP
jgi:predicted oxidoreductase (fatty acid repression mutant protein)